VNNFDFATSLLEYVKCKEHIMSISSNKQAQQKQKELASGLNHRWLDQQSHSVAKYHRQFKMSVDEETDSKEFTLRISLSQERGDTTTVRPKNSNNNNNLVPETIRDQYRRDGFVVFPNVLSQEDVNALNDRLEKVLRGDYDRQQKPDKTPRLLKSHYETHQFDEGKDDSAADHLDNNNNNSTKRKKGGASSMAKGPLGFSGNLQNVKVLQVINVHKADHLFRCLAVSPALGKAVAELAGWEHGARLAQDQGTSGHYIYLFPYTICCHCHITLHPVMYWSRSLGETSWGFASGFSSR